MIPDNQQAHELAEDCTCKVWVPMDKDSAVKVPWEMDAGDVCIRREVVEAAKREREKRQNISAPVVPTPEGSR